MSFNFFRKIYQNLNIYGKVAFGNSLNKKGFSIIEILAVIFIISFGLIGIISLVVQNVRVQRINKNNVIASMLAQEGLELVRNKRDANWKNGIDWKNGIVSLSDQTYTIDYLGSINFSPNNIDDSTARLYTNSGGWYVHGSGTATNFFRLITVSDNGDDILVSCTVRFSNEGANYDYTARTRLFNWQR